MAKLHDFAICLIKHGALGISLVVPDHEVFFNIFLEFIHDQRMNEPLSQSSRYEAKRPRDNRMGGFVESLQGLYLGRDQNVDVFAIYLSCEKPVPRSHPELRCHSFDEQETQPPYVYSRRQLKTQIAHDWNVVLTFEAELRSEVRSIDLALPGLLYFIQSRVESSSDSDRLCFRSIPGDAIGYGKRESMCGSTPLR